MLAAGRGVPGVVVVPPLAGVWPLPDDVPCEEEDADAEAVLLAEADVLALAVALDEAFDEALAEVVTEFGCALGLEHRVEVFCGADLSDVPEPVAEPVGVAVVSVELGSEVAVVLVLPVGLGLPVLVGEVV